MDFATIKTEVGAWTLDLPTSVSARVGTFVNQAVRDAADRHNFRFMESEITPSPLSTAEDTRQLVAKPADWKESRGLPFLLLQTGGTKEIDWAGSESEMNRTYAYQIPQETSTVETDKGEPRYLLERPTTIDVWPLPDALSDWTNGNHRIVVPYWAYPDELQLDNDTNWITENGAWYVIYLATSLALKFNRDDDRAREFKADAEPHFAKMRRVDKLSRVPERLTLRPQKNAFRGRSRVGLRG